jgi:hypothetical protein
MTWWQGVQRLARVAGLQQRVRFLDDVLQPVGDDLADQIILGREMPIDGPQPHPRTTGDFVDWNRQAFGRKGFPGNLQDARTVPGRVGT